MALKLGIQTYQILTNDDEICIPSLLAICIIFFYRKFHNRKISDVGAVANYDLLMFIQRGDF